MGRKSSQPVDKLVGQNIRHARMIRKLSQGELGKRCGVTFQQIQKYEKGTNRVGGSRLHEIAEALRVKVSDLFPEPGKGLDKIDSIAMATDRIGHDIIRVWPLIPRNVQVTLRGVILAVAKAYSPSRQ